MFAVDGRFFATPRILGSGLGRTGLTGRRDRSDRCHGRVSRTDLTGRVDRSDRYSWAERGNLGFVGEVSWKFVWLIVSGNFL